MEDKDKRRTLSLTIRYQPRANNPLVNVIDWLKSLNTQDRRNKVERLCLMTLLPYALKAKGKTKEEIECSYWEVHERLQEHLFVMRQTLGIKAPRSLSSYSERNIGVDFPEKPTASEEQNEPKKATLSDIDSIFGV